MTDELMRVEDVQAEVAPVVQRAGQIVVTNPDQYTDAAGFLKAVKAAQKTVTGFFGPMKAKAHEAWKTITAKEGETLQPLKAAEDAVKAKMLTYDREQERIRQAEQRRLQAIEDEKNRKERERAAALAKAQRDKEEAARRAEEEARQRAATAKSAEARAAAEKEAEKARKAAEAAAIKAEAREDAAQAVGPAAVIEVASARPVVKGQSIRKTFKARIVDPKAAVMAVMGWPDWQAYVRIQESEFNRFAQRTKGGVKLDGVEFVEDSTLASAGK